MAEPKTKPTDVPVDEFLTGVPEPRRSQAEIVRDLMTRATGVEPVMWGPAIIGYGSAATATGDWPVVAFSPRKASLTLYVIGAHPEPLLDRLGPHSVSTGCLYLKKLDGVDLDVLEQVVRNAWQA